MIALVISKLAQVGILVTPGFIVDLTADLTVDLAVDLTFDLTLNLTAPRRLRQVDPRRRIRSSVCTLYILVLSALLTPPGTWKANTSLN